MHQSHREGINLTICSCHGTTALVSVGGSYKVSKVWPRASRGDYRIAIFQTCKMRKKLMVWVLNTSIYSFTVIAAPAVGLIMKSPETRGQRDRRRDFEGSTAVDVA